MVRENVLKGQCVRATTAASSRDRVILVHTERRPPVAASPRRVGHPAQKGENHRPDQLSERLHLEQGEMSSS